MLNVCKYQEILVKNFQKSARSLMLGRDLTFQQDKDQKHTANATQKWFEDNQIEILKWSDQSLYWSPMERAEADNETFHAHFIAFTFLYLFSSVCLSRYILAVPMFPLFMSSTFFLPLLPTMTLPVLLAGYLPYGDNYSQKGGAAPTMHPAGGYDPYYYYYYQQYLNQDPKYQDYYNQILKRYHQVMASPQAIPTGNSCCSGNTNRQWHMHKQYQQVTAAAQVVPIGNGICTSNTSR